MLFRVYDIDYDTDGEEIDLPKVLYFYEPDEDFDPATQLADKISDKMGWCVNSLQFEDTPPMSFNFGDCPDEAIRAQANTACPDGFNMTIRSQEEWSWLGDAINKGIDPHLEAITDRSTFDASTGECLVHPDELHVLCRRLLEMGWDQTEDQIEGRADSPHSFRSAILETLDIEEV